jgi:geranylgeranyl diphosphate synthase type I
MLTEIKRAVEREMRRYAAQFRHAPLSSIPRPFSTVIEQFIGRKGKRLRSVLFVAGYRGYSARRVRNLYRSAAALELLHDFILIHDDLIDHASLRRGGASMHASLDALLNGHRGLRFKGPELALIVGDMLYAMAIQGFLSVSEAPARKQRALEMLTRTALYTGCGELDELLHTLKPLADVRTADVYRIYDWKTGHYTFSSPLAMGAILGGARQVDIDGLTAVGTDLGRAFQLRDDLLDLFGDGDVYGKPAFLDLCEGKKTLAVLHAYRASAPAERSILEQVLERPGASPAEIRQAADIIRGSGAPEHVLREMRRLVRSALRKLDRTRMRTSARRFVAEYAESLLQPPAEAAASDARDEAVGADGA